jgi:hypothetical protein
MKRTSQGNRRHSVNLERLARPRLEPLEDRLALAAAIPLPNAVPLLNAAQGQPLLAAPGNAIPAPVLNDAVFVNPLLTFGGGRRDDPIPRFPASGGNHQERPDLARLDAWKGEENEDEAVADEFQDAAQAHVHPWEPALRGVAEALIEA